jgi:tetratricopeptide (TPR) repeat protein
MNRTADRDVLLHVGLSKTGTSSIQACFAAARPALAARGVCYPTSPGPANHALLAIAANPSAAARVNPGLWQGVSPELRLARFRREFAAELSALPPRIRLVVLSAEQCTDFLRRPEHVAGLRDLVAPHARRIRVVVYLRRQDRHYASLYVQMLRTGGSVGPPALPTEAELRASWLGGYYDYAAMLSLWAGVFGREAILPRIFEPAALAGGDVVDDMLELCGIPGAIPPDAPDRRRNPSWSLATIRLALAMIARLREEAPRHLAPFGPAWRRFAELLSAEPPGPGWRPAPEEARAFLAGFADSNERVRAEWFPERASLFAPVEEQEPDPLPPPDPALLAACGLLMQEILRAVSLDAERAVLQARLAEAAGAAERAEQRYRAALRLDPDHAEAHAGLCSLLIAGRRLPEAAAHLEALRRVAPDSPRVARLAERLEGLRAAASAEAPR